jgi:hypothetical protein
MILLWGANAVAYFVTALSYNTKMIITMTHRKRKAINKLVIYTFVIYMLVNLHTCNLYGYSLYACILHACNLDPCN